jgi:hypothetical protein
MIAVIFRIALTILLAIFFSKVLSQCLRIARSMRKEGTSSSRKTYQKSECIDICPECGHLEEENHRCV